MRHLHRAARVPARLTVRTKYCLDPNDTHLAPAELHLAPAACSAPAAAPAWTSPHPFKKEKKSTNSLSKVPKAKGSRGLSWAGVDAFMNAVGGT